MNSTNNNSFEIDYWAILAACLKRWYLLLLCAVVGAAGAFFLTEYYTTPLYRATSYMYVQNATVNLSSTSITIGDRNAAKSAVDIYLVILKTRLTLEDVIKEADLNYSYEQLAAEISGGSVNETEIFSVTVTDPDPKRACKIANTVTKVLPQKIKEIMNCGEVRTVDLAVVPKTPVNGNSSRNTAIGLFAGLALGVLIVFLTETFNDTIRTENWLLDTFKEQIPLLAIVPDANASTRGYGYTGYYSRYGYGYGYGYGKPPKPESDKQSQKKA